MSSLFLFLHLSLLHPQRLYQPSLRSLLLSTVSSSLLLYVPLRSAPAPSPGYVSLMGLREGHMDWLLASLPIPPTRSLPDNALLDLDAVAALPFRYVVRVSLSLPASLPSSFRPLLFSYHSITGRNTCGSSSSWPSACSGRGTRDTFGACEPPPLPPSLPPSLPLPSLPTSNSTLSLFSPPPPLFLASQAGRGALDALRRVLRAGHVAPPWRDAAMDARAGKCPPSFLLVSINSGGHLSFFTSLVLSPSPSLVSQ